STTQHLQRASTQLLATLTNVTGPTSVNELKAGYLSFHKLFEAVDGVAGTPQIVLRGYTIGNNPTNPLDGIETTWSIRDDFTKVVAGYVGRHEVKIGAEALYRLFDYPRFAAGVQSGIIDATVGTLSASALQDAFPVWNDPSTWKISALSPITRSYTYGAGV